MFSAVPYVIYVKCYYICVVCIRIAVRRCEEVFRSSCVDGTCLPIVMKCDGHKDCVDGSDEENCAPSWPPCRPDEIECGGVSGDCVFKGHLCDGVDNCIDGSDENCSKSVVCLSVCLSVLVCLSICLVILFISIARTTPPQSSCLANQFPCTDGCVPLAALCDGTSNCRNNEDEQSCSKLLQ